MIISPLFLRTELGCIREMDCRYQELSADPHYVIGAPMCVNVCTTVPSVHNINSHTTTGNDPRGSGDSASAAVVAVAALLCHDRISRCHRCAASARRRGCNEDTGRGQHGIIGRSTTVGSAAAVAAAAACGGQRGSRAVAIAWRW